MDCSDIIFSRHALNQMINRNISPAEIKEAIIYGEILRSYPEDKPYMSWLILKFVMNRPLHVVVSKDEIKRCIVITAYEPDPETWNDDFKSKKHSL